MSQPGEQLTLSPEDEAQAEDQANLEYFLQEVGAAPGMDQPALDRLRTTVDAVIWTRMEKPHYDKSSDRVRDEYIEAIENIGKQKRPDEREELRPFTPRSLAHTRAIHGAKTERQFAKAARVSVAAGGSRYSELERLHTTAIEDARVLGRATKSPEGAETQADPDKLRNDRELIYLLGDRLMRREFLDNRYWPARNTSKFKNRQKYWRGAMLAAARYASDKVLSELIENERQELKNEAIYWRVTKGRVGKTVAGRAVASYISNKAGERTAKADEQEDALDEPEIRPSPEPAEVNYLSIPPHIKADLIAKYSSTTQRVKNMTEQGMSPRAAEEKEFAGGRAIWDEEGENIIGYMPKDEAPRAVNIINARRPQKTRVSLSRRGQLTADEAPPAIQQELQP